MQICSLGDACYDSLWGGADFRGRQGLHQMEMEKLFVRKIFFSFFWNSDFQGQLELQIWGVGMEISDREHWFEFDFALPLCIEMELTTYMTWYTKMNESINMMQQWGLPHRHVYHHTHITVSHSSCLWLGMILLLHSSASEKEETWAVFWIELMSVICKYISQTYWM